MLDRRLIANFDWAILGLILLIAAIGIMTIFSATRGLESQNIPFYIKQILWTLLGIAGMLFVVSIDYRTIAKHAYLLYGIGIFLLLLVLLVGRAGMGAQRWIPAGPFSFQPSEFARLFFILALSKYLSENKESGIYSIKELIIPAIFFLIIPSMLVIKQPDLGTGMAFLFTFFVMTTVAGLKVKAITILISIGILSVPFLSETLWSQLKEYQRNRIIAFFQPDTDPLGIGYHITQSKIAIGSGQFFGKGYLSGTQGYLRFLPERHTDFIFSVFAEEWGFIGCILLFAIYLSLIFMGIEVALKSKDNLGCIMAVGIVSTFSLYTIINIGMTLGITPIVGIPLPFISYGGSSMLTNFISIGLLLNIKMRRFQLFY